MVDAHPGFRLRPLPRRKRTLTTRRRRHVRLSGLIGALALFATACGGGAEADPLAVAAAEANESQLQVAGNIATTELLDAQTGEISRLSDVVTGDRAVLVWYWAPH